MKRLLTLALTAAVAIPLFAQDAAKTEEARPQREERRRESNVWPVFFAVCECFFTIGYLIFTVKVCLLIFLELVKSILQLVHVCCGFLTCLLPIVFASKNVIQVNGTAVKAE